MTRTGVLLLLATLVAACSATPSINRTRTTLGEVNMEGLECRRDKPPGSSIGRTICATPENWAEYEKAQSDTSQAALDRRRDQSDNRIFYPGMRPD
jgi:hypothetical protein